MSVPLNLISRILQRFTVIVGSVALTLMMLQISVDVVLRLIGAGAIHSTVEIVSRYYMVAAGFFPLALAELRRSHIEATVFVDLMPMPVQKAITYVGFLISFCLYGLLTYASAAEAISRTRKGSYIEIGTSYMTIWPSYWILPIAFSMMALVLMARIISGSSEQYSI